MHLKLSLPGNLLLAGEYCVLEEGGTGLTLAVEPRAYVEISESTRFTVELLWGRKKQGWQDGLDAMPPLIEAVLAQLGLIDQLPKISLVVDTRAFYRHGRKLGLGSSAAAAGGLTAGLLAFSGIPNEQAAERAFLPAVKAHRVFQNGRGSGYDIAASLFGGTGIFTGGKEPSWNPLPAPWLGQFGLCSGECSVKTTSAVQAYFDWKRLNPLEAENFQRNSSAAIRALQATKTLPQAMPILQELRSLSQSLGKKIGHVADIPESLKKADYSKALGAGNEVFFILNNPAHENIEGAEPAILSLEGLRWES